MPFARAVVLNEHHLGILFQLQHKLGGERLFRKIARDASLIMPACARQFGQFAFVDALRLVIMCYKANVISANRWNKVGDISAIEFVKRVLVGLVVAYFVQQRKKI